MGALRRKWSIGSGWKLDFAVATGALFVRNLLWHDWLEDLRFDPGQR